MIRIALLFICTCFINVPIFAAQYELYVSPLGNDMNRGSKEQPFKTIERARDVIRRVNREMNDDIIVYLGGGLYPIRETINFGPSDSGMNGHRVIYKAFGNGETVLSGATHVTGWKPSIGEIYETRLDHTDKLRSLFVNGQRAYMASATADARGGWGEYKVRAGQADWAWISGSTKDGVKFAQNDVPVIANVEDLEVIRNSKFNSHILAVREIATEGDERILKFQQPYAAIAMNIKYGAYHPSSRHTLVNAFEFLDEPGEFYFDRPSKMLYYYPRSGEDMATAEVFAPRIGQLVSIQGHSNSDRVSNLSFQGLTFAHTEADLVEVDGSVGKSTVQAATWVRAFDEPDWHVTKYRAYDTMPNAITISSAKDIEFANNKLMHIGNEGIGFINDVADSSFVGNLCYDIGGGAIQVGHPQHVYEGDTHEHAKYSPSVEGVCRNILVENNVLYDMTTMFFGHAPITAYFVNGLQIQKNHIQKCNYTAVSLGWGWNNFDEESTGGNPTTTCRNNVFSYNRVYDCMRMLHDGGAFYTLGSQPNSESNGVYVKASTTHFQGVYHPDEGTAWYTGKDFVFEIRPDQDTFELNKWRRKHDNHYSNVYTTSDSIKLGAPNCTVSDIHFIPDARWPEEALAIIRSAGIDDEYRHLLGVIPNIIFDSTKRYDTKESIISDEMIVQANEPQVSRGGRYEAEEARLTGDAVAKNQHSGFSGKGYAEGFYSSTNAQVTFTVKVPELGTYDLLIRYAAGHKNSKNTGLYVNGEKSEMLDIKSTGDWQAWGNHTVSVFLQAGTNTISFNVESKSNDNINIDYITISE